MNEWSNAIKAQIVVMVNAGMALILAIIIFAGLDVDPQAYAGLSLSVEAFVNGALGFWILLTYRMSATRVSSVKDAVAVSEERGIKAEQSGHIMTGTGDGGLPPHGGGAP